MNKKKIISIEKKTIFPRSVYIDVVYTLGGKKENGEPAK
jgi:hypothetical protein